MSNQRGCEHFCFRVTHVVSFSHLHGVPLLSSEALDRPMRHCEPLTIMRCPCTLNTTLNHLVMERYLDGKGVGFHVLVGALDRTATPHPEWIGSPIWGSTFQRHQRGMVPRSETISPL